MPQLNFSDFTESETEPEPDLDTAPEARSESAGDREDDDPSRQCPWCLASAAQFLEHDDGTAACGECDAKLPLEAEWFQRGEVIWSR